MLKSAGVASVANIQRPHGVILMKPFKKCFSFVLTIALLSLSLTSAQAALVSNERLIAQAQHDTAKTRLLHTIERADIREKLLSMGVNEDDITSRIDLLTHDEIAQLNQQIDELPAGGDLLGVILIIFIVFVITDVIGATDIFPFIKPVN